MNVVASDHLGLTSGRNHTRSCICMLSWHDWPGPVLHPLEPEQGCWEKRLADTLAPSGMAIQPAEVSNIVDILGLNSVKPKASPRSRLECLECLAANRPEVRPDPAPAGLPSVNKGSLFTCWIWVEDPPSFGGFWSTNTSDFCPGGVPP